MSKIRVTKLAELPSLRDPDYLLRCACCETIMPCKDSTCLSNDSDSYLSKRIWVCSNELCITMGIFMLLNGDIDETACYPE
jgi:hypothetical protein